ncbi:MAG: membrane protein insertase YidC [Rhodospirillaceae bacterium]|nr:membrane protein insertase YidC [Rhodospirillaceae bacterium]
MIENKNLILAVVLSVAVLLGFELYFKNTTPAPQQTAETGQPGQPGQSPSALPGAPSSGAALPQAPGAPAVPGGPAPQATRTEVLAETPRVRIETPRLTGSISLKGGRIDDLILADYRETLEPDSDPITLLSPRGVKDAYFAEFGWISPAGADGKPAVKVPDADTVWTPSSKTLAPGTPVTLSWDNGQGQVFKRTYTIDENFMFTVAQTVENAGSDAVELFPYGLVSRQGTPETSGFYILHEGLLGVNNGELKEVDYDDLQETKQETSTGTGGWIGITDKYWLTALIPGKDTEVTKRYVYRKAGVVDTYQVDFLGAGVKVAPGASGAAENRLFAGAKQVKVLDAYEESLGIERFDLAIDWGWFYFLTRPIFYGLLWLEVHFGNLGLAILLLTVGIKLAFFPLANKSYESMSKMKKLQPEMTKLRERYGDDKVKLNEEMMSLYKREGANPASGCLPILVQIPVFFALYKVLFVTIEMRHAPFYGWIHDLSAADPTNLFTLFGLVPWPAPDIMHLGVWPLLMGISMFLQQKLNPQPTDPMQAKVMMFLPVLFTFLLAKFPAGLVIYWTWNNLLSIAQQWVIMRRMGVKA